MKSRLTLRLNRDAIEQAKKIARKRGVSVSKLVEQYFVLLADAGQPEKSDSDKGYTPITRRLQGIVKGAEITEDKYKGHLERKYLHE